MSEEIRGFRSQFGLPKYDGPRLAHSLNQMRRWTLNISVWFSKSMGNTKNEIFRADIVMSLS